MILNRDTTEQKLHIPKKEREIPLIIQDKRIIGASLDYTFSHHEIIWGMLGDYICVNGVHKVFRSVGTTSYRLRILNGSNARIYDLALTHALPFTLIGTDCGLLDQSHSIDSLTLAPGERADVLINFSQQKINTVVDLIDKNNNDRRLLQFLIEKKLDDDFTLPKKLSTLEKIAPETAIKTRKFQLSSREMIGMKSIHRINGTTYDPKSVR